jgi:O-antigen ligase
MIKEHPLIGVGLNNFSLVMQDRAYSPEGVSSLQQTYFGGDFFGTVVHNKYLLVASEVGLVGLLFYSWLLLCSFRCSFVVFLRNDTLYSAVGAGIFAAFSGASIQMLSDIYNSDILITIFTVLIGLIFAVDKIEQGTV